ncbi:hypothetical protein CC1G_03911 [Coprinopsis cinerea okayama7|uniref:tRNA-splicing endonuclease subunit Sen34 n=1 Tax=Coprinopsis cinerea (strain Okayama-7 / 130 / ATCC MYA-4618 / FGSC 9003) TaxID=240176 RepID=A8NH66_COPC7|nr:hypothetical protein CC1G_03911 [Coprinopsis cinerea okayama7\|eukprot:XP_001833694.2 hypothetical protein CC1G_03911 [Coprinopsis cinerea okayama7\
MSDSDSTRPVRLRVSNKKAYVWDVDDIATIRSKYRLCGVLSGTLPHLSQQNVFLGIPLVLLPEEAVLLVETGAAVLVDDPSAHTHPFLCEIQDWNKEQEDAMKAQLALLEEKVVKESSGSGRALSEEAQRKRREREERKKALAASAQKEEGEEGPSSAAEPSAAPSSKTPEPPSTTAASPAAPPTTEKTFSKTSSTPYTITIPASSNSLSWYHDGDKSNVYTTLEEAKAAGIWDYPSNLEERARCGVFKGLWDQGYFMGGGIKFGGDYLVYPGHAFPFPLEYDLLIPVQ